ncbi:uncharacterized protein LOC8258232 isoform X2 [Ricinus communis]|uniref:uncharacterized protein LOC8258232 isoform X2 n=1 Tax=Ricinus communis TaxID=3988 RepID=UPI00077213F1|nr:uncharacterized protein LOC8258232 isoform X2 [Ricinus communis]|eukprot:XP_015579002.1 uncharacterized protein LOC8258232 isoform X2 [Ricinus communis]
MGIRDYISSTANAVNENAIKPVKTFCSTSYSHGHAAVTMIGKTSYSYGSAAASKIASAIRVNAVEKVSQQLQDEDAQSKMRQFASNIATNAAGFVFREALKTLPGGWLLLELVSQSMPENKKSQNHKKKVVNALRSESENNEDKMHELDTEENLESNKHAACKTQAPSIRKQILHSKM